MIDERILPGSGRVVKLQMPDLYGALAAGDIPNPLLAPIVRLIDAPAESDVTQQLIKGRANIMALYHLASLCLVEPKLILKGTPGEGEIGPADLRLGDLEFIYWSYFRNDATTFLTQVRAAFESGLFSTMLPLITNASLPTESAAGDQ